VSKIGDRGSLGIIRTPVPLGGVEASVGLDPLPDETDPSLVRCQSCSRPIVSADDHGTVADGSPSYDYCRCCLVRGEWVEPAVSQRELVERCVGIWIEHRYGTEAEVRAYFDDLFPTLKRWRGHPS